MTDVAPPALRALAQAVSLYHHADDTDSSTLGRCSWCREAWPCPEAQLATRVLALGDVEAVVTAARAYCEAESERLQLADIELSGQPTNVLFAVMERCDIARAASAQTFSALVMALTARDAGTEQEAGT